MAATPSSTQIESKIDLIKQVRRCEVAVAELSSLSSSRPVYLKNGNLFFRTTVQKATVSEQKRLDQTKAKLERLNSR